MHNETYRLEFVRCGKPNCKCSRGAPHGPYWYAYRHDKKGMHKRYVGKMRFDTSYDQPQRPDPTTEHNTRFAHDGRRMTLPAALRIFAFPFPQTHQATKQRYRTLMWEHHPDRGGDAKVCEAINAAYEYLIRDTA